MSGGRKKDATPPTSIASPSRARFGVAAARTLSYSDLTALLSSASRRAEGDGQVANQAAKLVLDVVRVATQLPEGDDQPDRVPRLEDMTPSREQQLGPSWRGRLRPWYRRGRRERESRGSPRTRVLVHACMRHPEGGRPPR